MVLVSLRYPVACQKLKAFYFFIFFVFFLLDYEQQKGPYICHHYRQHCCCHCTSTTSVTAAIARLVQRTVFPIVIFRHALAHVHSQTRMFIQTILRTCALTHTCAQTRAHAFTFFHCIFLSPDRSLGWLQAHEIMIFQT